MELLRKGSRLSVQPVKPNEWDAVLKLAGLTEEELAGAVAKPQKKSAKTSTSKSRRTND
ncbi:MAG: hypothetical protein U0835_12195 [Isosphaeraceae bacterium]